MIQQNFFSIYNVFFFQILMISLIQPCKSKKRIFNNTVTNHRRSQTEASLQQTNNFTDRQYSNKKYNQTQIPNSKQINLFNCTQRKAKNKHRVKFSLNDKLQSIITDYFVQKQLSVRKSRIRKIAAVPPNKIQKQKQLYTIDNKSAYPKRKFGREQKLKCPRKKQSSILNRSKSSILVNRQNLLFKQTQIIDPKRKQSQIQTINNELQSQIWQIQITKICRSIAQLKNISLDEKKINKWCLVYFDSKKKGLVDIFMKRTPIKKSLNDEVAYNLVDNEKKLWYNIFLASNSMNEKQKYFLGIEISLFRSFLQQKIAYKHKTQLNQIENYVRSDIQKAHLFQFAKQIYKFSNNNLEINNFYNDLRRIEDTYGKLNIISAKNRKRFEDINQSESNIKKFIYKN